MSGVNTALFKGATELLYGVEKLSQHANLKNIWCNFEDLVSKDIVVFSGREKTQELNAFDKFAGKIFASLDYLREWTGIGKLERFVKETIQNLTGHQPAAPAAQAGANTAQQAAQGAVQELTIPQRFLRFLGFDIKIEGKAIVQDASQAAAGAAPAGPGRSIPLQRTVVQHGPNGTSVTNVHLSNVQGGVNVSVADVHGQPRAGTPHQPAGPNPNPAANAAASATAPTVNQGVQKAVADMKTATEAKIKAAADLKAAQDVLALDPTKLSSQLEVGKQTALLKQAEMGMRQGHIDKLQAEIPQLDAELKAAIAKLNASPSNRQLQNDVRKLEQEVTNKRDQLKDVKSKIAAFQTDLTQVKADYAKNLQKNITEAEAAYTAIDNRVSAAATDADKAALRPEHTKAAGKLNRLRQVLADLNKGVIS